MSSEKATITTIAKTTGLSLATVSRALAGSPSVLPQTRERVLSTARELNYVRDRAAVRLKTGKTHVVAFIMDRSDVVEPGFKDLLLGISDALAGTEYHLIVLPESTEPDPLLTIRYVVERGLADGLVLTHTTPDDARVRYLMERGFPFITHGRTDFKPGHAYVDFANELFTERAVGVLRQRQRRRLGILLPRAGGSFQLHLADGFAAACRRWGLEGEAITDIDLDDTADGIYRWALQRAAPYDGLVVTREAPMLPLMSGLADAGRRLGQDIDVVAKYSTSLPLFIRQPLWTCFEDLRETGTLLGQEMLQQLNQPDQPPAQVLFTPPAIRDSHGQTLTE